MEGTEVPKKGKGPIVDPGLCRACRSIKKCRILTAEYEWMGSKEVYSDMFVDVFGFILSHLDGDDKDSCICATCVLRLREAKAFRHQVLRSEEAFLEARMDADNEIEIKSEVKTEDLDEIDSDSMEGTEDMDSKGVDTEEMESKVSSCSTPEPPEDMPPIQAVDIVEEPPAEPKEVEVKDELQLALESRVSKLKDKLDQMLDKPVPKEKPQPKSKKKQQEVDHDNMAYLNTVTIVNNSYVIPFHNRISNYYCYYCKDQFTNPNELREHTLQHDPVILFEDTVEYKKIPKIDITRIDCRLCDTKIDDLNAFKEHITSAHNLKLYPVANEFIKFKLTQDNLSCTECGKSFPYFDSLKKHMVEHFGTLVCDVCGACFLERNSLRTHIRTHSKVETNFPCEICGKNLKSKYSRYLHIATVHEKKATVNCYKCESTFMSYALRNRHLIEVHGDKRTFPCKLCDKVYNRRKTLMEHNRRNHQKVLRHECSMCDQRFYLPSRLKEHMATHSGQRSFRCEVCDKSYPRLQSLQEHVRTHSEKRYKCHLCVAAFTQHANYKSHLRNHHHGYKDTSYT
ncbi:uncharacterized protein [Epargyreus clarus]|uniref:uncharacterized protein isoform X1 n=2 Tax=Epargyreus clarus TaxID=520877 RepID=UPI003C30CC31